MVDSSKHHRLDSIGIETNYTQQQQLMHNPMLLTAMRFRRLKTFFSLDSPDFYYLTT